MKGIWSALFAGFRVFILMIAFGISCSPVGPDRGSVNKKESSIMQSDQTDITQRWMQEARKMVLHQLIPRGISDQNVLRVMENTPRHLFVPKNLIDFAYDDGPLPIGEGQTISQPYIVALMTELLMLKGDEKVLEIGTGSGYQAAVLSQLVDTCYSIELIKKLADDAGARLQRLGFKNVIARCSDGYLGWPEHAPFDCIIITAAPEEIPETLVGQLKVGGRMVLPVGRFYQELVLVTRTARGTRKESIIPVRFVPMVKSK